MLEYDSVRQSGRGSDASVELVQSVVRDAMSETLIQLKWGLG